MQWFFPENNFGQETGFNDAGVETFKGDQNLYLAREILQNCLDAADPNCQEPVRVGFKCVDMPCSQLPDYRDLRSRLELCAVYWEGDSKAKKFFMNAADILKGQRVQTLIISDYNTLGVTGGDKERTAGWYSLVKCSGTSSKGSSQGGSFGIGKNAPFASSDLRTVIYSTRTREGCAFQGVARLASHKKGRTVYQATGFLGDNKGASIRTEQKIPKHLQRSEMGTDIYILGFRTTSGWQEDLITAVLEDFWPVILEGKLVVEVEEQKIDTKSIPEFMNKFAAREGFTGHIFYL